MTGNWKYFGFGWDKNNSLWGMGRDEPFGGFFIELGHLYLRFGKRKYKPGSTF